jgi:PAS domain S-box-containing protein
MNFRRAITAIAVLIAIAHIAVLAHYAESHLGTVLSNLVQEAAAGLAFVVTLRAARINKGFGRQIFATIALAFGAWVLGQIFWTINEAQGTSMFSFTDLVFFFSFMPFALLLFFTRDEEPREGVDWQRTLDLVQFGIVIFCLYMVVFYLPTKREDMDQTTRRRLNYVYAVRNLLLAALLWGRAGLAANKEERRLLRYPAIFVSLYAPGTRLATLARLPLLSSANNWFDLGFSLPFLLAAVIYAAAMPYVEQPSSPAKHRSGVRRGFAVHVLPTLFPLLVVALGIRIAAEQQWIAMLSIGASFLCYSARLAVTQHRQEQAESQLRMLFNHNPRPMWVFERGGGRFIEVNDAVLQKYGYTRDEFLSMTLFDLRPQADRERLRVRLEQLKGSEVVSGEWRHQLKSGRLIDVAVTGRRIDYGGHDCQLVMLEDVTEQRQLEAQLRHSQKMEAVGTLAGGMAHDFNNLLTVITGYTQVAIERSKDNALLAKELAEIEKAAAKAAGLIRQLLAFSRKQMLQPQVIDLNHLVSGMEHMLARALGEACVLTIESRAEPAMVRADPMQLEHSLLNLVLNARDAMPGGGVLEIRTMREHVSSNEAARHNGIPGEHVVLRVKDQGCGIRSEDLPLIFEPFFTTKRAHGGSGLGLSSVYGIVRQSGGFLTVSSRVGEGSTFAIYLPAAQVEVRSAAAK